MITRLFGIAITLVAVLTACQTEEKAPDVDSTAEVTVSHEKMYHPESGDSTIVYINRFKPEYFEKARHIAIDGFSGAIEMLGDTRRTYFMVNPDSSEVIAIAFFHDQSEAERWQASNHRHDILAQLDTLLSQPIHVSKMELEHVHHHQHTGSTTGDSATNDSLAVTMANEMYQPNEGDSAILYMHRFKPEYFEKARRITIDGFSDAAEMFGDTRRTYFMVNPDSSEVIAAVFFHDQSEAEGWMASKHRHDILAQLDTLRSQPMRVSKMELERAHHHQTELSEK